MEFRVLKYFLETAREGSITRAAQILHVTQPTMSKQLKDLERELGKQLFVRSNYSVQLTEAGILLKERAEDIIDMVEKTKAEFKTLDDITSGDIYVGSAESDSVKFFVRAVKSLQAKYPNIKCHIRSGNINDVTQKLDKGLLDFAIIMKYVDLNKYNYINVPVSDQWGVLMRKDDPFATREYITLEELVHMPLICSEQGIEQDFPEWFGTKVSKLNIVATYNLVYNAAIMVREGLGYAITYDKLTYDNELCFKPIEPQLNSDMKIIWRKHQVFTPIAKLLIDELADAFK
ncbi:LysR family transcriptional regulator [bacterium]|nr:LysR family transcriptional regulator [bacterium]